MSCPSDFPFHYELRPFLSPIDQLAVLSCPYLCLSARSMYACGSFNQHSLVSVSPVLCFWRSSPQFLFTGGTLHARYVNLDANYCAVCLSQSFPILIFSFLTELH